MTKLLTRLKIDEVSAVDRGAGEDCRILLRKRDQDAVTRATGALRESVASILNCDDSDEVKRAALVETFGQFEYHLEHELGVIERLGKGSYERDQRSRREKFEKIFAGKADDDDGDAVVKASRDRRVGHHSLAAAVVDHALDRLGSLRAQHGFEKAHEKEKSTMDDNLTSISKSHDDLMNFCKRAVEDGEPGGVSETALVEAVTKHACSRFPNERSDVAFEKTFNASTPEGVLLRKTARLCRDGAWGYTSAG
jgi:hypothetical protein